MSTRQIGHTEEVIQRPVIEHVCDHCGKVIPPTFDRPWAIQMFPIFGISIYLKNKDGRGDYREFCNEPCLRDALNKEFPE